MTDTERWQTDWGLCGNDREPPCEYELLRMLEPFEKSPDFNLGSLMGLKLQMKLLEAIGIL